MSSTPTTPAPTAEHGQILVWDASPLHHAIKADRIDILGDMARSWRGLPRKNVTTQAVLDEVDYHRLPVAGLDWLEVVHVDGLDELNALVAWMNRVSGQQSNQGEATVLAWAEIHEATAVIDDADARRIGRAEGVQVWGSLRVVAESVRDGCVTEYAATTLVDALIDTGARFPCPRGGWVGWAKQNGLL